MKHTSKGPGKKTVPRHQKENSYKGSSTRVSGKSPESGPKKTGKKPPEPEANSENWEYPAESSHPNSRRHIENQREGAYKHDRLTKGPDDEDDFDDVREHGDYDYDDEEF